MSALCDTNDLPANSRPARILVADDDRAHHALLQTAFGASGIEVDAASGGREACEKLKDGDFRALVTDYEMPDWSGLQFLENARQFFLTPTLCICCKLLF
jgi:CheY-like chemotaxis protein